MSSVVGDSQISFVMRKFAVAQYFFIIWKSLKKTNSSLFSGDGQEFKCSTLYIADSLYTCTSATPTFI